MTTFALGTYRRGPLLVPRIFSATTEGGAASFVVPIDVTEIRGKCWGAGGGAGTEFGRPAGNGGAGGYAEARIPVTPGETLTIFVPTGGSGSNTNTYGGGGGSFAGIFRGTTALLIGAGGAGGGAGRSGTNSTNGVSGGAGGGDSGGTGATASGSQAGGGGGTQSAGGSSPTNAGSKWIGGNSFGSAIAGGANGAAAILGANAGNGGGSSGGTDNSYGGGGGAGWYGGGGGGRGQGDPNTGGSGGGGGSGYVTGTETANLAGSGTTPPNQSDRYYIAGRGVGGTPSASASVYNGGAGLVVILF